MRLFRLEIKRILKSRRTLILLAIALLLSVAMAYLPISFEGINRPNEDGTVTELDGLAAIKYKQDLYKTSAGEVTPDRIKSALETYQSCVREYGPVDYSGPAAHLGRSLAQLDRASAHLIQSAFRHMPIADQPIY